MADDVDYESDNAMPLEEEEERTVKQVKKENSSGRRVVKGRGKAAAAMDSERYPNETGIFDKLKRERGDDYDDSNAIQSVEGWVVFVAGVHEEAQEEHLLDAFGEDAQVQNLHMNLDRRTGFVKGYALIEFEKYEDAKNAIRRMDGEEILGSKIHVDWAFRKGLWRHVGCCCSCCCLPLIVTLFCTDLQRMRTIPDVTLAVVVAEDKTKKTSSGIATMVLFRK